MGGKLNIYNLGVSGVVVDKSPIHETDGELLRAQNAQVDSVGALGGIRKRDGFSRLNPVILAGAVTGMLPLPLPDEGLRIPKFYLPLESSTATWKTSFDGITWTDVAIPSRAVTSANSGIELTVLATEWAVQWRGFRNRLYYPGNDYVRGTSNPTIHVWDGESDDVIGRITPSPYGTTPAMSVTTILPYANNELLIAVADSTAGLGASRILLLNTSTHQLTHIGPETNLVDGFVMGGMVVWQGRVWIGGYHGPGGSAVSIYWARRDTKKWTAEVTGNGTARGYVTSMAVFKGDLYVSYAADLNAHGNIYKRTAQGVWSEVYASDGMGAVNYVGPMIVSQDGQTILAYQNSMSGGAAPQIRIIQSTTGSSWSLAYNISTALTDSYGRSGMPYLDGSNGVIYWPLASGSGGNVGGLLKRTTVGVWSVVFSGVNTIRGPLGIIRL